MNSNASRSDLTKPHQGAAGGVGSHPASPAIARKRLFLGVGFAHWAAGAVIATASLAPPPWGSLIILESCPWFWLAYKAANW